MHYTGFLMQVLQRRGYLVDDVSRQIFAKVGQTNNLMKQLAARTQFQDDVIVLP